VTMKQDPLFICDLANNHFGDISHAKQIISEIGKVARAVTYSRMVASEPCLVMVVMLKLP
jgi:sialic acid synthase SpsE